MICVILYFFCVSVFVLQLRSSTFNRENVMPTLQIEIHADASDDPAARLAYVAVVNVMAVS